MTTKPRPRKAPTPPLLVVDGDSFTHRAYHGLPKSILRAGKRPAGAIVGFANTLLRLYQQEQPRAVVVGWDTLEEPTYRHETLESYQAGRAFDDALLEQLELMPQFVGACGFANARAAGYEADDFLAAAAKREEKRGGAVLVASGDRDSFQLASDAVTILYPMGGGELARFATLEDAFAAGRLAAQADTLRLYRRIATMDSAAPLPRYGDMTPTWAKATALAEEWGLNALAERLQKLAEG